MGNNFYKIEDEEMQKWLKALRSGKYKQTFYTAKTEKFNWWKFKKENYYCAVGLGCKIAKMNFNKIPTVLFSKIITLNDNYKKTFSELADYIENNYNEYCERSVSYSASTKTSVVGGYNVYCPS